MAALRTGVSELENLSMGEDVQRTAQCLRHLGVRVETVGEKTVVYGVGLRGFSSPKEPLDCGNSGTTMRLFMGLLAGQDFETILVGDESLSKRPMKRVAEPLRLMGANISLTEDEYAPVRIKPAKLISLKYEMPVASSQVKSALILAGVVSGQDVSLTGQTLSRDHTERMLPFFLQSGPMHWRVPSDISAASFWITAALLKKVKVKLEGVLLNETRMGFVNTLREIGVDVTFELKGEIPEPYGHIVVSPLSELKMLKPFHIEKKQVPFLIDEIPLLVLIATQLAGTSTIRGAEELRYKESDRIDKTAAVLRALGAEVQTTTDGFVIQGPQILKGGFVETYHDHRLTMMAAVAELVCQTPVHVSDTSSSKISDPFFFEAWGKI